MAFFGPILCLVIVLVMGSGFFYKSGQSNTFCQKLRVYGSCALTSRPPPPTTSCPTAPTTPTPTLENIEMTAMATATPKETNPFDVNAAQAAADVVSVDTALDAALSATASATHAAECAEQCTQDAIVNFNFNLSAVAQGATTFKTKAEVYRQHVVTAAKKPLDFGGARPKTTISKKSLKLKKVSFSASGNSINSVNSNSSTSLKQRKQLTQAEYNKIAFELIEMDRQADLDLKNDMAQEIVQQDVKDSAKTAKKKVAKLTKQPTTGALAPEAKTAETQAVALPTVEKTKKTKKKTMRRLVKLIKNKIA